MKEGRPGKIMFRKKKKKRKKPKWVCTTNISLLWKGCVSISNYKTGKNYDNEWHHRMLTQEQIFKSIKGL